MNASDHPELSSFSVCFRYERGGFQSGGSRWGEDPRDEEDWSKLTTTNERLEKYEWVL